MFLISGMFSRVMNLVQKGDLLGALKGAVYVSCNL